MKRAEIDWLIKRQEYEELSTHTVEMFRSTQEDNDAVPTSIKPGYTCCSVTFSLSPMSSDRPGDASDAEEFQVG
jgi:hypothetical protein